MYINQNKHVKIFFTIRPGQDYGGQLPPGLAIRALAAYSSSDHSKEPVKVCYTHCRDSVGQLKSELAEHLIRCQEPDTFYYENPESNRHSVVTALPQKQPGTNEIPLAYKFMDLGSCVGGLNRRDTVLIFTLELA